MKKKYELTTDTLAFKKDCKVFRIKALMDFGDVKTGDLGGYIEKEENLSQIGEAWVYDDAVVCDDAKVFNNAQIRGKSVICGDSRVYNNAQIRDRVLVRNSFVYDSAKIYDYAKICDNSAVCDNAIVCGDAVISSADIANNARVYNNADYICFKGFGSCNRNTTMFRAKNDVIYVKCGCFNGILKEFEEKTKETHGSTKYAKEYLACIEAAKIHFEIEE